MGLKYKNNLLKSNYTNGDPVQLSKEKNFFCWHSDSSASSAEGHVFLLSEALTVLQKFEQDDIIVESIENTLVTKHKPTIR